MSVSALQLIGYAGYNSGLLPLLACNWAARKGRACTGRELLVAMALSVSFFVDSAGLLGFKAEIPTQWLMYLGAPLQFGMLIYAAGVGPRPLVLLLFFALVAIASVMRGTFDSPETFVRVVAGAWIAIAVLRNPHLGRVRDPLVLYCAGAIPFLLVMGTSAPAYGFWMAAWVGYQCVRISALCWMSVRLLSPEAQYGDNNDRDTGSFRGDRPVDDRRGGHRAHAKASPLRIAR
jgi:hypothetical protein